MSTFLFISITRGGGALEGAGGIWHPQVQLQVGCLPQGLTPLLSQPESWDQLQAGTGEAMTWPWWVSFAAIHLQRDMEMEGSAVELRSHAPGGREATVRAALPVFCLFK